MTRHPEAAAAQMLAASPLFASLSERQLRNLVRSAKERSFPTGTTIVREGDDGIGFYLVLEGEVSVRKRGAPVATLGAGQFFGEMALFERQPRTADVIATRDARCLVLSSWEFWGEVSDKPKVMRTLMQEMVRRLRTAGAPLTE